MGTPEYSLPEAIKFFSSAGFDGIEIIVQTDGYRCAIDLDANASEIAAVKGLLRESNLAAACLTPYLNLFNSVDETERKAECDRLRKVILLAEALDAPSIRIYGGKFVTGETDPGGLKIAQLVKSMRECGEFAKAHNVKLCMENHFGTMTTTAAKSAEIANLIDHPNVGILYDQANIAFFPAEEFEEAIGLQTGRIFHAPRERSRLQGVAGHCMFRSVAYKGIGAHGQLRIPGEGILDWPAILKSLKKSGYDGWLSLEYERRWQTIDLPHASEGMPRAFRYIKKIIDSLD